MTTHAIFIVVFFLLLISFTINTKLRFDLEKLRLEHITFKVEMYENLRDIHTSIVSLRKSTIDIYQDITDLTAKKG